jgi:hypothetical protein
MLGLLSYGCLQLQREGRGEGRSMEFSEEETDMQGLTRVSIPQSDLSTLSALLTLSIRIIEEEMKQSSQTGRITFRRRDAARVMDSL